MYGIVKFYLKTNNYTKQEMKIIILLGFSLLFQITGIVCKNDFRIR